MTFPFVRSAVDRRRLFLHAAWFDVATGQMSVCDPRTRTFAPTDGSDL
jgi:carbonic anhydrase